VKTSVRTITEVSLESDDKLIEFNIAGNGFLYNMVRIITGTLVEVGMGKLSADAVPEIIESRDRKRAGKTAPADGLYLVEVYY
jgi:tRNA pseudouridine38-40 synthase